MSKPKSFARIDSSIVSQGRIPEQVHLRAERMPRSDTRFNLYIHHGRRFPTEDLDDWGQPGPILKNCVGIHSTYQNLYAYFATPEDCNAAKQQTGWEDWRENSLIMRYHHDLLVAKLPDGSFGYFGDWGLIAAES